MTQKSPRSTIAVIALPVLLAFGAGYGVRAGSEKAAWERDIVLSDPSRLVRTADGELMVDAANKSAAAIGTNTRPRTYKPDLKLHETLQEVKRAIETNFVRTKIDESELTYGAVRGMLRSLNDRFTRFLTPDEYDQFRVDNEGEFTGIGARIDSKDEYYGSAAAKPYGASRPYIVEPMDGGPAAKAGLLKDDVILAINGRSTADMSEEAVVSFIRGTRGTSVNLKVERKIDSKDAKPAPSTARDGSRGGNFKVFDVALTRDIIEVHPVTLEWLPDRIAWLRLDEFNKKSDPEMIKAIKTLQKGPDGQGPARGLVLDLRNNPGGLLDVAVDVGSYFIQNGPIVYTRERNGSEEALNAERNRFMNLKMPVVVLINRYSASAAEIVTGALKDKGLATVVGETSYGKASVQVLVELKNGGALVITTAKYLTPGKRDISEKGISPDVAVSASDEDEKTGRGAQLQKAVNLIKEKSGTVETITARAN